MVGPLAPAQVTAHRSCDVNNTDTATETAGTSVTRQQQVQQLTSGAIAADVEPEFSVQESIDTVTGLSCIMQIVTTELINKFYSELREAQKLDAEPKHLVIVLNDLNFVFNKEHDTTYHVQNGNIRPFIPLSMRNKTFNAVRIPAHMGPHATKIIAVCKRFYWPKMKRDIDRWAKSCTYIMSKSQSNTTQHASNH